MILVVEDSKRLQPLIIHILESGGYQVLVAEDARTAMEMLTSRPDVRLMLTDVMLPQMTGLELARLARAKRPQLKVLYMSGFDSELGEGLQFIQKPFTPDSLLDKIAAMLGD